jgi:hypothetical protein
MGFTQFVCLLAFALPTVTNTCLAIIMCLFLVIFPIVRQPFSSPGYKDHFMETTGTQSMDPQPDLDRPLSFCSYPGYLEQGLV